MADSKRRIAVVHEALLYVGYAAGTVVGERQLTGTRFLVGIKRFGAVLHEADSIKPDVAERGSSKLDKKPSDTIKIGSAII